MNSNPVVGVVRLFPHTKVLFWGRVFPSWSRRGIRYPITRSLLSSIERGVTWRYMVPFRSLPIGAETLATNSLSTLSQASAATKKHRVELFSYATHHHDRTFGFHVGSPVYVSCDADHF